MTEPIDNSQKFERDICPAQTPYHVGHITSAMIWRADRNSGPWTGQRQISKADVKGGARCREQFLASPFFLEKKWPDKPVSFHQQPAFKALSGRVF